MNNVELAESLTAHIQQMLDMSSELNDLVEKENQLHSELTLVGKRKSQLQKEIKEAKKLLDWCIETRSDPTQARLSNSDDELKKLLQTRSDKETLMEEFDVLSKALWDAGKNRR